MRITHVVPHIDQEASGPSYSVPRLCQSLSRQGNTVELKCLAAGTAIDNVTLTVHRQWPVLPRLAASSDMAWALRQQARHVDIIHNHSLWSMVNVAAGCVVPGHRAKLVTSPRGTLSAWAMARSRTVKRLLWPFQKRALTHADLLHATCEAEYQQIRASGLAAPVVIIPNGVDVPQNVGRNEPAEHRTLLFLSRIHPTKGVDILLNAWRALQDEHPDWRLVIAGTGEAVHIHQAKELATALGARRVDFPGPLYGEAKAQAYHDAQLFVLPTHSENFGMVVAEALAHGCPAVVSKGAPWHGLESERCGWWVDNNLDVLAGSLGTALQRSASQLHEMGLRGRNWMARDYSWGTIGSKMDAAYRWLLEGGQQPPYARID